MQRSLLTIIFILVLRTFFNITFQNDIQYFMHICFIIDNSLQLKQQSANGISHIDTIKGSIQIMLRTLSKSGLRRENQMIHLFATSNPQQPISSFEHDQLHFQYQLKNIECKAITYPSQTIQSAFKQIGKFRILTETQTIIGYREGTVYEPGLILFFTSKLSQKNINKILTNTHRYQMRSEYKFILHRVCLPLKSEKNSTILDTLKKEIEGSSENKKLQEFVQKMNKGELKNIYYEQGKDSLSENLIKEIESYRPSLCMEFKIESEKVNYYGNLLTNSDISFNIQDQVKIQFLPLKKRCQIPLPMNTKYKQTQITAQIQQLSIPKYYLDLTRKLTVHFQGIVHQKYSIVPNSIISRIQKELRRHSINEQVYPIFFKSKTTSFLFAFLYVSHSTPSILITYYPNPPMLFNIVRSIQLRKNPSDHKNIQNMLNNYLSSIPYFYIKFLYYYFLNQFRIKIPYDEKFCPPQAIAQNKLIQAMSKHRKYIHEIGEQNAKKHAEYTSKCCPIYGQNQKYQEYSKSISKLQQNKSIKDLIFAEHLQKINQFQKQLGICGYLSIPKQKLQPITTQLEKYSIRKDDYNENIMATFGNPYKKKKKEDLMFMEDTPMPIEAQQTLPTSILEVEQSIVQTNLAVQKNIIIEPEKAQIDQIMQKMDEQPPLQTLEVLQYVNSISSQPNVSKISLPFNHINLRPELYQKNVKKFKEMLLKKK